MKLVIWGAGYMGGKQLVALGRKEVAYFIDSDERKKGKLFCGKKVYLPDEITEWNNLYIYVPYNYYNEISQKLIRFGLVEGIDFIKYFGTVKVSVQAFRQDFKRAMDEVSNNKSRLKNKMLFWGWNFVQKNDYKSFFEQMHKINPTLSCAVIGENIWMDRKDAEAINNVPTVITPIIFDKDIFLENCVLKTDEYESIRGVADLEEAVHKCMSSVKSMSEECAFFEIYYLLWYVEYIIDLVTPQLIILVGSRSVRSIIIAYVCRKRNIKLIYTHAGFIPGTYLFDSRGELGGCVPNIDTSKFNRLYVSDREITDTEKILSYLKLSGANRKIQPRNACVLTIRQRIEPNKPIVLFAAQPDTDFEPYNEEIKNDYSPVFKTSLEAGVYVSEICAEKGWNCVYKAHPLSVVFSAEERLGERTIYVENGNINDLIDFADVVVTIQSSTNYVALIRGKPVVMLGYNQTKGKGCTYEAFEKDNIGRTIEEAIKGGFTEKQQKAFVRHIAQSLKYYLYDDLSEREMRYGRQVPKDIASFFELESMLIGDK